MDERSAFGVIHKSTEFYQQEYVDPVKAKRKEDTKDALTAGAAGAGGAAAVGAGAAGYGYHKAKPAIKAYKAFKTFGSNPQDADKVARGAKKTWRVVQTLLKA